MQKSPTPPASRRRRTKPADDGATVTPKKPRTRKASARPANAKDAAIDVVAMHPQPAGLQDRIATTAYFLAAERNFEPGRELEDWLEAERRVRAPHL